MTVLGESDLTACRIAIGRVETRSERLEPQSLRRYALAVGADEDVERALPPLAHWAFFLPSPTDTDLGEDGHPKRGGFLPDTPLPRRMFAAATMRFAAPLRLGETAELTTRIADITHKVGRSGDLLFVELERTVAQNGMARVEERQTIVYRDAGGAEGLAMPVADADAGDGEMWTPSSANLFRFSAVTFNAHRIHYDLPYATGVEGYPALVVHGPFVAARLAALAARSGSLAKFRFRAHAPIFAGQAIRLREDPSGELQAVRCDGVIGTSAWADLT